MVRVHITPFYKSTCLEFGLAKVLVSFAEIKKGFRIFVLFLAQNNNNVGTYFS